MRRLIAITMAGATAATVLMLGVTSASAAGKFTCTRKADGHTVTVRLPTNRAEDAHEAHGWTCTGDRR
jgi:hypothetical protein